MSSVRPRAKPAQGAGPVFPVLGVCSACFLMGQVTVLQKVGELLSPPERTSTYALLCFSQQFSQKLYLPLSWHILIT